jgi:hypothetical protein
MPSEKPNLPFDTSQAGVETSRAVHPTFLFLMEHLLSLVGGTAFQILIPFLFCTKAEALDHPAVRRHADCIGETFSCDRFPDYFDGKRQCGICPSCVLRRMSLEVSGLGSFDPSEDYALDIKNRNGQISSWEIFSGRAILAHYLQAA